MAISNGESGSSVRTKLNASLAKTDNITITQAVDLDTLETNVAASKVKTDLITVTQGVDLDAIETNSNASKVKTDFITVTQNVDLDTIESTLATALQPSNIVETITNGVTTNAPSENAVFDALALKVSKADYTPAHSLLVQQSGTGSPTSLAIANNTILGKQTGDIDALTASEVRTVIDFDASVAANSAVVLNTAKVGFTTELAQDAVGAMINDSLVYDDATPALGINLAKANVFTADQSVPDDAYDATTWNGNMEVPTKNAIRDKIESLSPGGGGGIEVITATLSGTQTNYAFVGASATPSTDANILTVFDVTPSSSFIWQSLNMTGYDEGKRFLINNATEHDSASARCMLWENENGGSGTQILYQYNGKPLIQMPESTISLILLNGKLRLVGASNDNNGWDYFDDFLWTPVSSGSMLPAWKFGSGGTSSIATNTTYTIATDIRPIGVLGISTSSASAVGSLILQQQNLLEGGRGSAAVLWRPAIDTTLSTGSDTWIDYVGFLNGDGSSVSNAVGWKYDASVVGNWFTVTANNSVETTTTGQGPTAAVAEMPYLGVFCNGTWGNIEFFYSVDGVSYTFCATAHTTNIPTATNRLFSVGVNRRRTAGTSVRILAVDLVAWNYKHTRTT